MVASRWIFVFCMCAAGCVDTERATFAWPVGTHPTPVLADGSADPRWTEMVAAARAEWSVPLVAMGCADPFDGTDGTPVILVPDTQWSIPDEIGETRADRIIVKGTMDEVLLNGSYITVLPHELGHALGLEHVTAVRDPDSIMHTPADQLGPSQLDLDNAAAAIGCR